MSARPIYSVTEILGELRREQIMRKRLYPRWIAAGSLRQQDADRQIAIIDQVIADYSRKSGHDDLFVIRLNASVVAAEVAGILGVAGLDGRDVTGRVAERIARAMREGK